MPELTNTIRDIFGRRSLDSSSPKKACGNSTEKMTNRSKTSIKLSSINKK
jgi:hypothetical protein